MPRRCPGDQEEASCMRGSSCRFCRRRRNVQQIIYKLQDQVSGAERSHQLRAFHAYARERTFFLVNEAVAGSKQAAWDIAIKLATMLDTGAIKEDQRVAERAKLSTVIT
jgi:hypothetical protein